MELNTQKALANLGHDKTLYQFLVQSLIDELPHHIDALKQSKAASDPQAAARTAHVIKGHLLMFGCESDAAICNDSQHQLSQCQADEYCQTLISPVIDIASLFLVALKAQ